jgi:DNA-binding response OmpR family regulator
VWLAWGTTVGVLFLALPLVVPVWRTGLRLRPTLRFPSGEGPRAARLAFAGVGALVVQQLSVFLTLRAANAAGGDGTLSVYLYAQQVYLLPYAVLAFPIATSAFPHFAEHASAGRLDELRSLVARTTRSLLLVTAAGAAALMAAAPYVERVFDLIVRGDAPGMAAGLVALAPGLIGFALILHLSRALYAVDHGRAAVVATASGWGVSAIGAALVPVLFAGRSPGRGGAAPASADNALQTDVMAVLGAVGTAGMVVAGLGLLLAVRRHLGPDRRPKVLVVEDEEAISEPLAENLEREGFTPVVASTGAQAIELFERESPDLVLLDLGLPDRDGRDVCRDIRARSAVPVVMLTARGEEVDRILGLELGADDYIVKPFSAREVAARIRAVLRRSAPSAKNEASAIAIGDVRIDPKARTASKRGEPIELTAREFDLLLMLMSNAGKALRREEIMDEVWDTNWFGSTKTLDVHVSWLRRKIEDDPADPRYISTIRRVGFRFAAPDDLRT